MNNVNSAIRYAVTVLAGTLLLSSCAPVRTGSFPSTWYKNAAESEAGKPAADYSLGPDDVVRVTVEQHPEWSGEFPVGPDGNIAMGRIGEIPLEGKSQYGAEIVIASRLEEYINNPKVSVDIVRYASQSIYVLGEVARPGKYGTEGKVVTLRDAVVTAGLPTRFAATRRVFVITPSRQRPSQRVVNLGRVLYRGETRNNVLLNPGDTVYIPRTLWGEISEFFSVILSPLTTTLPAAQTMTGTAPLPRVVTP